MLGHDLDTVMADSKPAVTNLGNCGCMDESPSGSNRRHVRTDEGRTLWEQRRVAFVACSSRCPQKSRGAERSLSTIQIVILSITVLLALFDSG